jgi:hypothetical protein
LHRIVVVKTILTPMVTAIVAIYGVFWLPVSRFEGPDYHQDCAFAEHADECKGQYCKHGEDYYNVDMFNHWTAPAHRQHWQK